MKRIRNLFTVVLVIVLVFSIGCTGFAASSDDGAQVPIPASSRLNENSAYGGDSNSQGDNKWVVDDSGSYKNTIDVESNGYVYYDDGNDYIPDTSMYQDDKTVYRYDDTGQGVGTSQSEVVINPSGRIAIETDTEDVPSYIVPQRTFRWNVDGDTDGVYAILSYLRGLRGYVDNNVIYVNREADVNIQITTNTSVEDAYINVVELEKAEGNNFIQKGTSSIRISSNSITPKNDTDKGSIVNFNNIIEVLSEQGVEYFKFEALHIDFNQDEIQDAGLTDTSLDYLFNEQENKSQADLVFCIESDVNVGISDLVITPEKIYTSATGIDYYNGDVTFSFTTPKGEYSFVGVEEDNKLYTLVPVEEGNINKYEFTASEVFSNLEQENEYKVIIRNKAGQEKIFSGVYRKLTNGASINVSTSSEIRNINNEIIVKDYLALTLQVEDKSGLEITKVVIEDANGNEIVDSINGGVFIISANGEYTISAYNEAGIKTSVALGRALSMNGNSLVIFDGSNSVNISANRASDITIEGRDWFKSIPDIDIVLNGNYFNNITVTVNGETKGYNTDQKRISLSLQDYTRGVDGKYNISCVAEDVFGNVSSGELVIYVEDEITLNKGDITNFANDENKSYFVSKNINGDFNIQGAYSGVMNIELKNIESGIGSIQLKDGKANWGIDLTEDEVQANWVVVITTNAMTEVEVALKDIYGFNGDVVIDEDIPVITFSEIPDGVDINGKTWYSEAKDVNFNIDEKNIRGITVNTNGQEESYDINVNNIYTVSGDKFNKDTGRLSVTVDAVDVVGRSSSGNKVIFIDIEKPTGLSGSIKGEYIDRGYGIYSKSNLGLELTAEDRLSGIKDYLLNGESNADGKFSIGTGDQMVDVVDNVGNYFGSTTLRDLIGLSSNTFYIDNVDPSIEIKKDKGTSVENNNWYSDDINFNIAVNDEQGIHSIKVYLNDTEVSNIVYNEIKTSEDLVVRTGGSVVAGEDGSYNIRVEVEDNAGNSTLSSDKVFIDKTVPTVEEFVFTGGIQEGLNMAKDSNTYGFFFTSPTTVAIKVNDEQPSSGISRVLYSLENADGKDAVSGTLPVENGEAILTIPESFKGTVYAKVVDNVENESEQRNPDGSVVEDRNWHIQISNIELNIPETGIRDGNGINLYNNGVNIGFSVNDTVSGLKEIRWGVGNQEQGRSSISLDGTVTGSGLNIVSKDKNLVIGVSGSITVDSSINGQEAWIECIDRAGYESSNSTSISVDTINPVLEVEYDMNGSDYYNTERRATIRVKDDNFSEDGINISGEAGDFGGWVANGDGVYTSTMVFSGDDKDYKWGIQVSDRAGNSANSYESEEFTVDMVRPVIDVSYTNNDVQNGMYYKDSRDAIVTVEERNFDTNGVNITGNGELGAWSADGNKHTATVRFPEEGEHEFSISISDLAKNDSDTFDSGKFIVDAGEPKVEIQGVVNGTSYKKDVSPRVVINDTYLDANNTKVTMVGEKSGNMEMSGGVSDQTATIYLDNIPVSKENDDIYTLSVEAKDKAGNSVENKVIFSVNRFGSDFEFLTEDLIGNYVNKIEDVNIKEYSVDQLDMIDSKAVIVHNGNETEVGVGSQLSVREDRGTGEWVYDYTLDKSCFSDEGAYLIQIYSKELNDDVQNSSVSVEYGFIYDASKPDIIVSGIENNKSYEGTDVDVVVEVRDLSGVQNIRAWLNGQEVELGYDEFNQIYLYRIPEGSDYQEFIVEVEDKAGNKGTTEVTNFFISSDPMSVFLKSETFRAMMIGLSVAIAVIVALLIYLTHRRRQAKRKKDMEYREMVVNSSRGDSSVGEIISEPEDNIIEEQRNIQEGNIEEQNESGVSGNDGEIEEPENNSK